MKGFGIRPLHSTLHNGKVVRLFRQPLYMNKTSIISSLLSVFVISLLCVACATPPIASQSNQTSDLAQFTSDALQVAELVGSENILVVFDIDNTLLAMEQDLGADQWYEWQKQLASTDPCHQQAVENRLAIQGALYFASAMRPTQIDTATLLRSLQDAGIPVIALTSRGVDFRLQTFRELRRNGFDLRRSAIGPQGGWDENFIPDHGIRPARFEDGVFLTTGQHKGAMLKDLLHKTNTPMPKVILMLDDKQKNLDAVGETFSELNVPVRLWRYTGEDKTVEGFDADKSHIMLQELLPALQTIQKVLGPDNYQLPVNIRAAECADTGN